MRDPTARGPINGSKISAGHTYFGQFIDHDLTLDQTSQLGTPADLNTLPNGRTSFFDLDNCYGVNNQLLNPLTGLFDIGKNSNGEDDLPRDANGFAIIGDDRNDENLIVSQLHLAFLKFHNRVLTELKAQNPTISLQTIIAAAKQKTTDHYQWLVVHDFLSQICGRFFDRLFDAAGNPIISPEISAILPNMPIEFSGALYRFGHSMVRDAYYINNSFDVIPIFAADLPAPLITPADLRGGRPLPTNFTIDWSMFFSMADSKGFQVTERLDTFIAETLFNLPKTVADSSSLPLRNLRRGNTYQLPCGQDLARFLNIPTSEILSHAGGNMNLQTLNVPAITQTDLAYLEKVFGEQTPLFYYGLMDNQVNGNGDHLGSLPSKVIGETILGLMLVNPNSILNNGFVPQAGLQGCVVNGRYTFAEFFTYALGLPAMTGNELLPTPWSNFFDPFGNKQFQIAQVGHPFNPVIGLPSEFVVSTVSWTGFTPQQFEPTLALIEATQAELNQVATNARRFGVDQYLAVVNFLNCRTIVNIAQGLGVPLPPDAPPAIILPPAVQPPPTVPPAITLTRSQQRANLIFSSQDWAQFMLKPQAIIEAANANVQIFDALLGLVAPAIPSLPPAPTPVPVAPIPVLVPTTQIPRPHGNPPQQFFNRIDSVSPAFIASDADLALLAETMRDPTARGPINGSKISAGHTYFGQFIDHDLTLDQTSQLGTPADLNTLPNGRTSFFDLDSCYGVNNQLLNPLTGLFDIGKNSNGEDDLPRDANGFAIIGDDRNDENLIVSQLHLAFLKFHNRVLTELKAQNPTISLQTIIAAAKQKTTDHYQWLVVHDFLSQICGRFFDRLFDAAGNPIISPEISTILPNMPIEFSGALYRFGHSMVRDAYYINNSFDVIPIFAADLPAPLITPADLRGGRPLPTNFTIDWSMFFSMPNNKGFQVTERLDTFIAETLFNLPKTVADSSSLPLRNLRRGNTYQLPCGQDLARFLNIPTSEILSHAGGNMNLQTLNVPAITQTDLAYLEKVFGEQTPLFYYGLMDNQVNGNGDHLGSLPSKVIGETILGLMLVNPNSILNNGFVPQAGLQGCVVNGQYTFAEFFTYALGLPAMTGNELLPTPWSNFFDPFGNKQFQIAQVGHPFNPVIGLPSEFVVSTVSWTGFAPQQFDPTVALIGATQIEVNQVAANARRFGVDQYLAVVRFVNNRQILAIAQGAAPLPPDAPPATILPPAVQPPPTVPPAITLTPSQQRADYIFQTQDVAAFMLQPDAILDSARANNEIINALSGLVAPPV